MQTNIKDYVALVMYVSGISAVRHLE